MNDIRYDLSRFESGLSQLNISLSREQTEQFVLYFELLTDWNSRMNLTAITEWEEVVTKHFIDSLVLIKAVNDLKEVPYSVIDVGTGAGFPGIPLKIVFPNLRITLLDSLNKRVNFLNEVIDSLGLSGIDAVHGRAEDFASSEKYRQQFDLAVSRAVANMTVLSEFCIPFVKVGGRFISYKSEKVSEEISDSKKAFSILGGKLNKCVDMNLPDSDIFRSLVIVDKVKDTPLRFPRRAGIPAKEPLN